MRLGLHICNFTWSQDQGTLGDTFGLIVQRAERAGMSSVWVMDHFFQFPLLGPPEQPMLEGWTALAYAAGRTNQIHLGTLLTGVTNRHPGILVKMATTLDVLSHGRTYFGIGIGGYEEGFEGLGIPFPPQAERFERLEETLQIALQMWSADERPYEGKHYHLARPLNSPQPTRKPHPPILIAGNGERKTLRLVAQYGDACYLSGGLSRDERQRKLAILREHCQRVGRPYEQIEKTVGQYVHLTHDGRNGSLSPQSAIDLFSELASEGFDHVIFALPNVTDAEPFDLLGSSIIPVVSGLGSH